MPFDTRAPAPLAILYVTGRFPVLAETFVSNEIRAMRDLGHSVVPLALNGTPAPCQPRDEVLRAETLHLRAQPLTPLFGPRAIGRAMRFVMAQRGLPRHSLLVAGARVAGAARRMHATHIHAHFAHAPAAIAITAARLAGLTCSFTGHGFEVYGAARADLAEKIGHADCAVAVCEDMATDFRAAAPGAHVAMVPCGVDPARFRRPAAARSNGRLLAIGRLVEQKGYEILIEALAGIPPERRPVVDVVGAGPREAALRHRAQAWRVAGSLRFLGPRPAEWIAGEGPSYMGLVAPYVICADGDRDTGPLSVKEAMAMELPVIASALMGMKESVTAETGMLVPPGDAGALAAAIDRLVAMPMDARRALGRAGRERVLRHFTLAGQAAGLARAITAIAR